MSKYDGFDYETMVQDALKRVVHDALKKASQKGLSQDHHFYITFDTNHSRVDIPDYLKEEYPSEMTIVLQHEFWDLNADSDGFQVTLCFDDSNERISVPFDALISFVDPSVKFGLQFSPIDPEDKKHKKGLKEVTSGPEEKSENTSNVISIDSFRKR